MNVYLLVAIPNAAPWNNGRTDTQTQCVVIAANEDRARQRAAFTSGSEGWDCWVMRSPTFIRIEVLAETTTQEIERTVMSDTDCG